MDPWPASCSKEPNLAQRLSHFSLPLDFLCDDLPLPDGARDLSGCPSHGGQTTLPTQMNLEPAIGWVSQNRRLDHLRREERLDLLL